MQILYMKSEARDMVEDTAKQRYSMSPRRLELTLDLMQHFVDQAQVELDWVRRLREQEIARQNFLRRHETLPGTRPRLVARPAAEFYSSSDQLGRDVLVLSLCTLVALVLGALSMRRGIARLQFHKLISQSHP